MKFFVQNKRNGTKSKQLTSHDKPQEFPSCILVHNDGWNDYGSWTWFSVFYYGKDKEPIYLGDIKLMHSDEADTCKVIGSCFDEPLDDNFCSLGLQTSYYYNLVKEITDRNVREEILRFLRDCTFDKRIYEKYRDHPRFRESLIRDMSSQEALDAAEFILNSDDPDTAFSFTYEYHPDYDTSKMTNWEVSFLQRKPSYLRTVGIIGENGVGKTMLLTNFVKDLLKQSSPSTISNPLHFQSCVAICSSDRDGLLKMSSENKTRYIPCCLRQKSDETYNSMHVAIDEIMGRPMLYARPVVCMYYDTLKEHIQNGIINNLFDIDSSDETNVKTQLNEEKLKQLVEILSSGQLQMFELITYLYAHIHLSSLIIFDEPEVHMHPSLIMDFMPLLNKLLKEFKSFSMVCTHSPLVIRELVQKNVYRMSVNDNMDPSITRVAFRTFGEDISVLYRNIFDYDESKSYYRQVVRTLIVKEKRRNRDLTRQKCYNDVISFLEKDMELGLSGKSAVRDLVYDMIQEKNEEVK